MTAALYSPAGHATHDFVEEPETDPANEPAGHAHDRDVALVIMKGTVDVGQIQWSSFQLQRG